jgi:peroxiredoxin
MSSTSVNNPPASAGHRVRPREPAPDLTLPLVPDGTYRLRDQHPESYTMVVFFRGLHCPICRAQLTELNRRFDELLDLGIDVVAVSAETRERTDQLASEWRVDRLRLAYGLTEEHMRSYGLFVSRARKDDEPPLFNEPGLFLITPDGTVYYESILSAPVGRPRLDDLLSAAKHWRQDPYPARGEA